MMPPHSNVSLEDRQKIYQWLIRLKQVYDFEDNTPLVAIKLFDRFIALNCKMSIEMIPLVAMTCLQLAIKMHENSVLDFKQAIELCYQQYGFQY